MKKKYIKKLICFLLVFGVLALFFAACDGGDNSSDNDNPIVPIEPDEPDPEIEEEDEDPYTITEIAISPLMPYATKGKTKQLDAEVKGVYTDTGDPIPEDEILEKILWVIKPFEDQVKHKNTKISDTGLLTVAGAEELSAFTVIARARNDFTVFDEVTVRLRIEETLPIIQGVSIDPETLSLLKGQEIELAATVTGTNEPPNEVIWSVVNDGRHMYTSINSYGVLTVSDEELLNTITVKAASMVDPSVSGTLQVTLQPAAAKANKNIISYTGDEMLMVRGPQGAFLRPTGGRWYEFTLEYKALGSSRALAVVINDNATGNGGHGGANGNVPGERNHGMPCDWWINGEGAWQSKWGSQDVFGTHPNSNKRMLLPSTGGNWRTVKLAFITTEGYWPWAATPLRLAFYFNPFSEPGVMCKINYVAFRRFSEGIGSPYDDTTVAMPAGDLNSGTNSADTWGILTATGGSQTNVTGTYAVIPNTILVNEPAPLIPEWFNDSSKYND
jgi:hypothetical protein